MWCFAESFAFVLGSKDLLTKETTHHIYNKQVQYLIGDCWTWFQYIVTKRKEIETIEKSNNTYIAKLSRQTSRLKQYSLGSPLLTAIWSSNWGTDPGCAFIPLVKLQIAVLGTPTYNLRPQINIIISFWMKMQLWFYFNSFTAVYFFMWFTTFSRGWGAGQASRGLRKFQDPFLLLSKMLVDLLVITVCSPRQCSGRLEPG